MFRETNKPRSRTNKYVSLTNKYVSQTNKYVSRTNKYVLLNERGGVAIARRWIRGRTSRVSLLFRDVTGIQQLSAACGTLLAEGRLPLISVYKKSLIAVAAMRSFPIEFALLRAILLPKINNYYHKYEKIIYISCLNKEGRIRLRGFFPSIISWNRILTSPLLAFW